MLDRQINLFKVDTNAFLTNKEKEQREYLVKLKKVREKVYKRVGNREDSMKETKLNSERNTNFEYEPTISILVPLFNTDTNMLKCVIESVTNQTYSKWELCLCDGSDETHSYVADICKGYAANDKRIIYKALR